MNNEKLFKKYIINISVLSSVIVLIIAGLYNEYIDKLIRDLIAPIFSSDLNNDGIPDLDQLQKYVVNIGKYKFPLGNLFYNILVLILKIFVLYYLLKLLLNYLDLKK